MTLNINGHEYPLHFGMKAMEIFYRKSAGLQEGAVFYAEYITAILWGGLQNGAYRAEKTLPLSFADVCDWVDNALLDKEKQKVVAEVVQAFTESQTVKAVSEKTAPADSAKKKRSRTLKK